MFIKTKKLNNSKIFCIENHIYNNYEINNDVITSRCHVCQVSVVHIIVENLLNYISTNFYRTQPTFGDAMMKMQVLGFFWNIVYMKLESQADAKVSVRQQCV